MQRPRVSRYELKSFLTISWNPSGVIHDRLLEKSLKVTLDVYYHLLTLVADKYRSHYNKTAQGCEPLLMQDYARKHTTNQTKNCSSTLNFDVLRHSLYSADMATNGLNFCRSL